MHLALLLLPLLSGANAVFAPNVAFALSVSDMSPLLQFSNLLKIGESRPSGWEVRYSGSSWPPSPGTIGVGNRSHIGTWTPNVLQSLFETKFPGTGITVRGTVALDLAKRPDYLTRLVAVSVGGKTLKVEETGYNADASILGRGNVSWGSNDLRVWVDVPGQVTIDAVDVESGLVAVCKFFHVKAYGYGPF